MRFTSPPGSPARSSSSRWSDHWARTANPLLVDFHIYLHSEGSWFPWTGTVMNDWSANASLDAFGHPRTVGETCTGVQNGHVNVCDGNFGAGWSGVANVYIDGYGHIFKASIQLNDDMPLTSNEKRNVYCHEVGHALGLEHWNYSNSCMDDTDFADLSPRQHDHDALNSLYAHADGYNTSHSAGPPDGCRPPNVDPLRGTEQVTLVRHVDVGYGRSFTQVYEEPFFVKSSTYVSFEGPIC